jgi:hypothetical protein
MQHDIEVYQDHQIYTAVCSCGWLGRDCLERSRAVDNGDTHLVVVASLTERATE